MLQKISIIWKKTSSKSCLEINSLQKSQWVHMSIPPPPWEGEEELEGSKDLHVSIIILY